MSDSEDDGAFASAGEGDDIPMSHTSKKGQLTPQSSSGKNDNKNSNKGKNKKNQQKKKGKMAKSTDEEIVDKFMNSFESSDSTISSEMTTPQVDNVQLPKPDMEDVRITDESDDNRMKSNFSEEDDQSDVLEDCSLKRLSLSLDTKEEDSSKETLPDKNTALKENQEKSGKVSNKRYRYILM